MGMSEDSVTVCCANWPIAIMAAVLMMGIQATVATAQVQRRDEGLFSEAELPKVISSAQERARYREGLVGIVTGQIGGVYARLGGDLMRLLDDRENGTLRVAAMIGSGSISNVADLRNLHGIDFAITQGDVLEAYERTEAGKELQASLRYVSRLHTGYLHIVTRRDVINGRSPDVCVLDGKRVNVAGRLSGTSLTVRSVLQRRLGLNLTYDPSSSTEEGIEQLKARSVDAVAFVVGKPASVFAKISGQDISDLGLELLAIPEELLQTGCASRGRSSGLAGTPYEVGQLMSEDYTLLVPQGRPVPTIGVPSVLAAYAWSKGNGRYQQTRAFVEAFFDKAADLGTPGAGYAPNWCGVDLGREVGGWRRIDVATDWIRSNPNRSLLIDCGSKRLCSDRETLAYHFDDWYRREAPGRPLSGPHYLQKYDEFRRRQCP